MLWYSHLYLPYLHLHTTQYKYVVIIGNLKGLQGKLFSNNQIYKFNIKSLWYLFTKEATKVEAAMYKGHLASA